LIFVKTAGLALSESSVEEHEEKLLFINLGVIGIDQLRGTASHGDHNNDHAGSDNHGSSS
jgi:hypothetical protein